MTRPAIIVYDILDDDRRNHLRALLAPLADRFQQSGWLVPAHCRPDPDQLVDGLSVAFDPGDRVQIYAPCANCVIRARWLPINQPHRLYSRQTWIAH